MSKNKPDASEQTFQEGTTPVQAFSTPVIPADPENGLRLRQGRPPRAVPAKPLESAGVAGAAQAGT
ncbi:MAG TPA: hypothetical protein DDY78_14270 [Planctomycetales bacterium]|jgi:hypothetical protein|nr:hypothetical protein [Planctomycetales bacterium]